MTIPSPSAGEALSGAPRAGKTVWIIDDDATCLMLGEEILAEQGFAVRTFSDSALALAAIRAGAPDIVVLDVMMPGMSGFELCARLRADPLTADLPVLMATSLDDASSIDRGYDAGATNFATKPINWVAEGHRLRYMLRAAENLRQRKALEAQYLHGQKLEAVGTLAGGIAHDFNNILLVIQSNAELLQEEIESAEEFREICGAILEASKRGTSLARQLLTFSRKGAATSAKAPLCLNGVVRDMTRLLGRVIPENVTVRTDLDGDLASIHGSADQAGQVLMNLATNALHAMPHGGVLRIETRTVDLEEDDCRALALPELRPGRYARLLVSDTGHGMDPETMRRMFEPFFSTKEVGRGTGLGLSVVYGIVREHGGHVACSSEVGAGTLFSVYFPARAGADGRAAPEGSAAPPAWRGGDEHILLVDDDVAVRASLRTALRRAGYSVTVAEDGERALARYAEAARIDLVVLDLGMPNVDGWECLRRLRAVTPDVRVLLSTGYGGADLVERARRCGAAGLVRKPFPLREFLGTVRGLLDGRSSAAA